MIQIPENFDKDVLVLFFIREFGMTPDQATDYVLQFPNLAYWRFLHFDRYQRSDH